MASGAACTANKIRRQNNDFSENQCWLQLETRQLQTPDKISPKSITRL